MPLKCVDKHSMKNIPSLVQIMACCRIGNNLTWTNDGLILLKLLCVTLSWWVTNKPMIYPFEHPFRVDAGPKCPWSYPIFHFHFYLSKSFNLAKVLCTSISSTQFLFFPTSIIRYLTTSSYSHKYFVLLTFLVIRNVNSLSLLRRCYPKWPTRPNKKST